MQVAAHSVDWFFVWLWRASWQASVVIALVALVQVLFQKQWGARCRHWFWLLVIIRLALPWSVESRLSVFNWFKPGLPVVSTGLGSNAIAPSNTHQDALAATELLDHTRVQNSWWTMQHWLWFAGA